ncbi:bifunctional oligoribonuclease/PAP phosphatase NrnA [Geomicrobium sp. JCM 19039]|uniref:DHH family phosphoesterase n=1 Tax=Geomicrobium sp. JCM 19039 TaxID=1460636 RepID=UPI00045F28AB|nr:bifunctional oligoribonuclease/PAP phosphatase NrnA [Geomicrobium sp. JCM 19039]GAK12920.1 3'-to-5' oligoribonuclease A [Geomicrobium sp. JCM 19039]
MKQNLFDTIEKHDTIIIVRHVRPDPDAFGSQKGLAELIQLNTNKTVYMAGEDEPSLSFLATMDNVPADVWKRALVIICDTANRERIDGKQYEDALATFKVDHHPPIDQYADEEWVDTECSSTSEMVTRWYVDVAKPNGWKMSDAAATLLYAGIVGDTGRFRHPNTTSDTLKAASVLFENNIDLRTLFANLYKKPLQLVQLEGEVLSEVALSEAGVSVMTIRRHQLDKYNVSVNESSALVHSISDVDGLLAWVMFVELSDGTFRVRLRSKAPVINGLAERYGGGGHPLAAGALAKDESEIAAIVSELNALASSFTANQTP